MKSGLAAKLTIHDPEVIGVDASEAEAALAQRRAEPPRLRGCGSSKGASASPAPGDAREGLRRLLLCGADVFAAAAAMVLVLTVLGDDQLKLVTLAATPVVVLFFKVAGLYDREQLRLLRSTLDEAPALVQVAGPLRADDRHPPAPRRGRASMGRSDRRALADELHRDPGSPARPPAGWPDAPPRSSAAW